MVTGPEREAGREPSICSRVPAPCASRARRTTWPGRPVDAARSLTAALDEIDRAAGSAPSRERLELRCKTLITLALTEFMLSGVEMASARLAEAEELVDDLGDDQLRARLDYQRANIHGRVGDLASAWDGLEGAVRRLDAFTEREQCSVHLSRGMLAFELLRPQEALESFAEAARLAHELGGVEQEFMARHNEGYAAYLLGDIPRSLAGMARAQELEADVFKGPARLDRAQVLLEAGLVKEAVEALHAGLAELAGDGHDQMRAEFELALARAHRLLGHLDLATGAAVSARETYGRIGATAWAAKARLVELLVDLDRQRRTRRAQGAAGRRAWSDASSAWGTPPGLLLRRRRPTSSPRRRRSSETRSSPTARASSRRRRSCSPGTRRPRTPACSASSGSRPARCPTSSTRRSSRR